MADSNPGKPRKRGIFLLPNLLTTGALFAGFYAIVAAIDQNFLGAVWAIYIAMFLDGLDGRVARMTSTESDFGKEYDSLSDMVSFGLAPAIVTYQWGVVRLSEYGPLWGRLGWLAGFSLRCICRAAPGPLQHQRRQRQAIFLRLAQSACRRRYRGDGLGKHRVRNRRAGRAGGRGGNHRSDRHRHDVELSLPELQGLQSEQPCPVRKHDIRAGAADIGCAEPAGSYFRHVHRLRVFSTVAMGLAADSAPLDQSSKR